ncbi:hypothetical protein [Neobacillus sp. PS2-9]|uniref:hypothetical protein n=1 Tax=Neobacillus sp. PS2-9 TaxID=3070676 RepID=UPI0027E13E5E|nr:hypothetical protein [Neobacillus sp. PS2-9]WML56657.1 hypothetical protein RCG25_17205 [Neobacillus sp. PS2-9]
MDRAQELLIAFVDGFDLEKELNNLSEEEACEWILEEWSELQGEGVSSSEATSIIIDSNYKWMSIKPENKIFVFSTLMELNQRNNNYKTASTLQQEIEKILDITDSEEKKSKELVF